jgi:hypothetical protein
MVGASTIHSVLFPASELPPGALKLYDIEAPVVRFVKVPGNTDTQFYSGVTLCYTG